MSQTSLQRSREEAALDEFEKVLLSFTDPRRKQGQYYPLKSIIVIALMAMVCGCEDGEAMEIWGEINKEWLSGFLELPHGAPTQDVFLDVFAALNPSEFSAVFIAWMKVLLTRMELLGKHIAVDGKTSRRSFDKDDHGNKIPPLHTVSAWLSDAGLVLGQCKTAEKSNEITAIPELLKLIDIRGATITIDAMGCQTEIAQTIVEHEGHYLLAVKENQPTLYRDVQASFRDALDKTLRPLDQKGPLKLESHTSTDKGHGRIEERVVHLCRDLSWLTTAASWPGLSYIAMVESKRTELSTQKTSMEYRYYIGSELSTTVKGVGEKIRRHWGIENGLHWVLDMVFREDEARHRAKNCAANFATLRHFTLNLLKKDKTQKVGIANKRKLAGFSREYLLHILTGATLATS